MPKLFKLFLFVVFPLFLLLGGAYGLAKVGVIPVRQLAKKNRVAGMALHLIGLDSPKLPARQAGGPNMADAHAPAADPLAAERKSLLAQRTALDKEKADWEAQRQTQTKSAEEKAAADAAATDPRALTRLAAIYEQMPADAAFKIFSKMPDGQVVGLLRKMDEKKAGQILAIVPPDRAARITLALTKPAASDTAVAADTRP